MKALAVLFAGWLAGMAGELPNASTRPPPKSPLRVLALPDRGGFATSEGRRFVPMGVNYFRPGTGWAPQVWKQFDAVATRRDFARLKAMGANCVRVFLTFGSFYLEPGTLNEEGIAKFDQFLALAEEAGLYVHPTGPDHWEGLPEWARGDRFADEQVLSALEMFWTLFARRYAGRTVLFAYDLLNEPEIRWDSPPLQAKWNVWLKDQYGSEAKVAEAWGATELNPRLGERPVPPRISKPTRELLDYQRFRESVADTWTRRQVTAIKAVDPAALVTVGFIQWSVPYVLGGPWQYSAFRPERQEQDLDFLEFHFYPLARGFYEYGGDEDEARNLAYVECLAREMARWRRPVVLAEFGWYGGGRLTINDGKHPPASEEQQARWCRRVVETTAGWVSGWLNWGFHDHPQARDVTELTGLLTAGGQTKAWGLAFEQLARQFAAEGLPLPRQVERPTLDWDRALVDPKVMQAFREDYFKAFQRPTGNSALETSGSLEPGVRTEKPKEDRR